jgi:predicted Rossmann-fold nucleotide-binding protein
MRCRRRSGFAAPLPLRRARMIERPGPDSYRVTGTPSRSRMAARKSAAFVTVPGGFEVSMRTYD